MDINKLKALPLSLKLTVTLIIAALFSSCTEKNEKAMEVINDSISQIETSSAVAFATVIDIGEGIEEHGHCWSENTVKPAINNSHNTTHGKKTSAGSYSSAINGLSANNTYYVWAYVTNHEGTKYSDYISFTTQSDPNASWEPGDYWTDPRDGQKYKTVQIGSQVWMAENLNVGTRIDGIYDAEDNGIIEKYCYDDSQFNCDDYGGLYQWNELMNYTAIECARGICPDGWHVPSDDEWKDLESCLGMDASELDLFDVLRSIDEPLGILAGGSTGFNALMGGGRTYVDGEFRNMGDYGYFVTSTLFDVDNVIIRIVSGESGGIMRSNSVHLPSGYSVRCIKD